MSQEIQTPAPVATVEEKSVVNEMIDSLIKQHTAEIASLKATIVTLKKLQKEVAVEFKDLHKEVAKRRKVKKSDPTHKRKPSGFAAPFVVSDALYDFLEPFGVVRGTPIARTSVTKYINLYIKKHNLQNPEFRREIIPDATLKAILGDPIEHKVQDDETSPMVYTYLRLQCYLNQHFRVPQPDPVPVPVPESAPESA